ncbi:twin-arginine translocase TatA/TatE family subunit [Rhodoferax sp. 4810]|uniref:Sec-independent protein translocase protein TatA n=1 Tax=Thiospirillum jenense TaxID=1653858 RepID=A0A839HFB2_9GAMM|nr:twin-arginine translocase TatA/TatE family subunit [Thiospirillum jenense]MBB1076148.1 twin-arginine translocase TatA/TatE family subunit [Rhodoferax jenense]MBB1126066.1 twin-arginine translocase TatA/TatE family subunit [Thiospirillum jenense]
MGLSGLSLGHILMVLLVVILVFGTKKLSGFGSDLGEAIKGFRKAMSNDDAQSNPPAPGADPNPAPAAEAVRTAQHADVTPKPAADDRHSNQRVT